MRLRRPARPPPLDVAVRPAERGDAQAVAEMAGAPGRGGGPPRFTAAAFLRDGFGGAPAFRALVAECGGEAVGYAVYCPGYDTDVAARGVWLADLYVRPAFRRRGAGRALLRALAARARADGGRWMVWSVLARNRAARRFYRRLARELPHVRLCAAFGPAFDALADAAGPGPTRPD